MADTLRYMVFAGTWYYPKGGVRDLQGTFEKKATVEKFILILRDIKSNCETGAEEIDWVTVYDTKECETILELRYAKEEIIDNKIPW